MNQLLNMALRLIMNKGMKAVSRRDAKSADTPAEARELQKKSRENLKKMRQASRILRRMGRF